MAILMVITKSVIVKIKYKHFSLLLRLTMLFCLKNANTRKCSNKILSNLLMAKYFQYIINLDIRKFLSEFDNALNYQKNQLVVKHDYFFLATSRDNSNL